jgi:hypothetical protein
MIDVGLCTPREVRSIGCDAWNTSGYKRDGISAAAEERP